MKTLLLISLLLIPVHAQNPRAIELIRVRIVATPEASETEEEFNRLMRAELGKLKTVAFTSQADYDIACAAVKLSDNGKVFGYAVSVMVMSPQGKRLRDFTLSISAGPSLEELAAKMAAKLKAAYFNRRP